MKPQATRPPGRPKDPELTAKVNQFLRWQVGDSLFIPDINSRDIEFFRRAAIRAGAGIRVVDTKRDSHHQKPGVRMIRRPGPYDSEI